MVELRKTKKRERATRVFTDRETPQKIFSTAIQETIKTGVPPEKNVITFYGVGGIGKTRLRKELAKKCQSYPDKILWAEVDFARKELRTLGRFLCEIVNQLEGQGAKFPHFKIAYSIYFAKKSPDIKFNEDELPFIDESGLVASIISSFDGFGIVGAAKDAVQQCYKLYTTQFALNPSVKEELESIEHLDIHEIEDLLISFFSFDLESYSQQKKRAPVIFLDTYEALLSNKPSDFSLSCDDWLKVASPLIKRHSFFYAGIYAGTA
ncbi:hypothetical protein [Oceanicoccus sagamiensis]|uniref:Orc1-like AAA ATPase domain-containing protein n=1 Tax=Oceanicoccus sagamiensis TaxID=716816 RepID=A0A1X9NC39_9GAMM|nr:hypothetical protein [Oceanicoccus sagamiensis]ARN74002.1 hypothetical protein BST96_07645 [Oceanicoccus sagamiensis]